MPFSTLHFHMSLPPPQHTDTVPDQQKGRYDSIHQEDKEGPMRCEFNTVLA